MKDFTSGQLVEGYLAVYDFISDYGLIHTGSYWFILIHTGSYWFILANVHPKGLMSSQSDHKMRGNCTPKTANNLVYKFDRTASAEPTAEPTSSLHCDFGAPGAAQFMVPAHSWAASRHPIASSAASSRADDRGFRPSDDVSPVIRNARNVAANSMVTVDPRQPEMRDWQVWQLEQWKTQ